MGYLISWIILKNERVNIITVSKPNFIEYFLSKKNNLNKLKAVKEFLQSKCFYLAKSKFLLKANCQGE